MLYVQAMTPDPGDSDEPFPIPEADEDLLAQCRVDTFRAGGPGGQHQNTTESGVRLVHLPTGIQVEARDERSQHRNKALALRRLRARLEHRNRRPPPRVPTRVPPGEKRKRIEEKRRRGEVKRRRRPPDPERD
jgi:protein subunit release factor A